MKNLSLPLECDILNCENEDVVIQGFIERYNISYDEAQEIFEETKKWLWLASKSSELNGTSLFIDKPLLIIDEMWHNFILHTKQYYKFCFDNFKRFLHHVPSSAREKAAYKQAFEENPTEAIQKQEEALKKQYTLIYDHLGPETLLKWYDQMAQKYTPEYIKTIRKE